MTRLMMTADAVGGVWTWALALARALKPLGLRTMIAIVGPSPAPAQRAAAGDLDLVDTGLPLDWLAPDEGSVRQAGAALARLALDRGADLLMLHAAAFAAMPCSVPRLVVAHSCPASWWVAMRTGPLPPDLAWRAKLAAIGYAAADRVVAPSHAFARATVDCYDLAAPPAVVWNGLAPLATRPKGSARHALVAGRLWDEGKDVATLDRAARLTKVPICAAGPIEGPDGQRLAAKALQLLGPLDARALGQQLALQPIFLSAARYEPFGLAVLEAAQAGCALILSDIATHRELWDGAALFVPPGSDRGFAAAIDRLADDPAARAAAGAAAAARARRYGVGAMAAAMAGLIRPLALGSRQAA